ncbi:hypothetical protein BT69DRAFT_1282590, partial [Atractiella rhizophila]
MSNSREGRCDKGMSDGRVALSSHFCSDSLAISRHPMPVLCSMTPSYSLLDLILSHTPLVTFDRRLLR